MTFTIDILGRAKSQLSVLGSISPPNCVLQQHGKSHRATINTVYVPTKRVEDAYRYKINISNSSTMPVITNFKNQIGRGSFGDKDTNQSESPKIVLVIESPHKFEYCSSTHIPIAPAQKTTGKNIHDHIATIFMQKNNFSLKAGSYDFIICNPVQFQASLYDLHKKPLSGKHNGGGAVPALRDKAWRAIYTLEKCNFFARLTSYAPEIIINACTTKLRKDVTHELNRWKNASGMNTKIFVADKHPCQWSKPPKLTP